jgi:RNA polymerase sigma-70 factor (ECF subfamily)
VSTVEAKQLETQRRAGAVSLLLRAWGRGDLHARDELVPVVSRELRRRAGAYLKRERRDHSLQPTALVHEAYLRLVGQDRVAWQNRAHFFGVAAQMMRRILIDYAREHHAAKRPGAAVRVTLDDGIGAVQPRECEMIVLDEALSELTHLNARQGQIVELRYFGGLSEEEVATVLSVSRRTVTREWRAARAWLYRRITTGRTGTKST